MVLANIFGGDGIIVLIVAIVVIFGGSQLPKIARNVGSAGKEFRKAQEEAEQEAASKDAKAQAAPAPPPAVAPAPAPAPAESDKVTLSKAELNALLEERESRTQGDH